MISLRKICMTSKSLKGYYKLIMTSGPRAVKNSLPSASSLNVSFHMLGFKRGPPPSGAFKAPWISGPAVGGPEHTDPDHQTQMR